MTDDPRIDQPAAEPPASPTSYADLRRYDDYADLTASSATYADLATTPPRARP